VQFHALVQALCVRREPREWSACDGRGPLSALERQTAAPLGLQRTGAATAAVRTLPPCRRLGPGGDAPSRWRLEESSAAELGEAAASVLLAGSGFPTQGTHAVGGARQSCGHLGKSATGPPAVCAASSRARGDTLRARWLSLPETWVDAAHTRWRTHDGVPDAPQVTTAPQRGRAMVQGLPARGHRPVRGVRAAATDGAEPTCRDGLAALGKWSCVAGPGSPGRWVGAVAVEAARQGPLGRPRRGRRRA
jgi:hypothetical protein